MWANPATVRNVAQLRQDSLHVLEPAVGEMAEKGEAGQGRMPEVSELVAAIEALQSSPGAQQGNGKGARLDGRHVLITSGPTHEPIDPVRYIANRSSGKQGHAIAAAAAAAGARVTLVSGPVAIADPPGVNVVRVETADDMLAAVKAALPADAAIFAAAVADWRVVKASGEKIKKSAGARTPTLELSENPDILKTVAKLKSGRPDLVVGFAAETHNVLEFASGKLKSKGADWVVANDVSEGTGVMGGDRNSVHLISAEGSESWPEMSKADVAHKLVARIADHFEGGKS